MIWFGFYIAGGVVSFVYAYRTVVQMNARYSFGTAQSRIEGEDWAALTLIALASWAGFFGTLGFRLSAEYGLWGRSDDA